MLSGVFCIALLVVAIFATKKIIDHLFPTPANFVPSALEDAVTKLAGVEHNASTTAITTTSTATTTTPTSTTTTTTTTTRTTRATISTNKCGSYEDLFYANVSGMNAAHWSLAYSDVKLHIADNEFISVSIRKNSDEKDAKKQGIYLDNSANVSDSRLVNEFHDPPVI